MIVRGLQISLAAFLAVFVAQNAGRIEGRFFPVTGNATVSQIEWVEYGQSRIWGHFELLRAENCDFRGVSWFFDGVERSVQVPVVFEEGAKERPDGLNGFGPWRVQLEPDIFLTHSYAIAYHRCQIFGIPLPWKTETTFYKSE